MDVLNIISWLKNKRQVTTVDASQTLIPLGLKDPRRDDGYLPSAISVEDLASSLSPNWGTITGDIEEQSDLISLINASSIPYWLKYNENDKTIWNNGKGDNSSNTSFGENSLQNNVSGYSNTAIGSEVLQAITTGNQNTGIGAQCMYYVNGSSNIAIGNFTMGFATTCSVSVAIGNLALSNSETSNNIALGDKTLRYNTTGQYNVGIGNTALQLNTSGINNTAVGEQTLTQNYVGSNNTAIGAFALNSSNNSDGANTAVGSFSLFANSTGTGNTALGAATQSGNFNNSLIIGRGATATASNQFVVGSTTYNAGTIATETITANRTWTVRINGANYKIPLLAI